MNDTMQERKDLIDMRDEKVAELAAIAARIDADRANSISSRIRTLSSQIERLPKPGPAGKYVTYKVPTHALAEHLKEAGHAIRVADLIREVLAEGYLGGGEAGENSIRKSLGSFATGRGTITGTIRIAEQEFDRLGTLKDGWVWLGEWNEPRIPSQN